MTTDSTTTWMHPRKGKIVGRIVGEYGEFVDIRLVRDQVLKYSNGNEHREDGDLITVRKGFLTKIEQ